MEASRALAADQAQDPPEQPEEPEAPAARPRLELVADAEEGQVSALDIPPAGRSEAARHTSQIAVSRSVDEALADRRRDPQARSGNFLEKVIEELRRHGSPRVRAYRTRRR